ncbi:hypothetical protein PtB15_8B701 [Puccinia triticina]|nr:hypothetical protein PtB15_8B701 [Puccinia triticina]
MRFTVATSLCLALLNTASAQLFGGPLSVLPTHLFSPQNDGGCGGNGGYAPVQMSCGNQGNNAGFSLANINALTSIHDCFRY